MPHRHTDPPTLPKPPGLYSQVVQAGNLVFVAGQTATDTDGRLVGGTDPEAQARQVYANVRAAVESVGATLAHVVKQTIYITDASYLASVQRGRGDIWPADGAPTSTLVVCKGLARPEYLVEVEVIAVLED